MPRVEDIAWKFVIRQGKKWRCPHCQNEYSGSVTRVRSHFLKQSKEGIAPCTKVPEHISTLMESLHNQVRNKEDIAWKFVKRLGDNKWRCHHCTEEFFGDLTGVTGHLLEVPNEGISMCTQVPDHVRTLMRSLLDEMAEEESRGANGQSSMEPQSRHMPIQAEVAEEESREANSQFFTGPQSRERPTQAEVIEEESRDANIQFFTEPQGPLLLPEFFSPNFLEHMEQLNTATDIGLNSPQQSQAKRQFHQSSTMPSLVQSSHGESSTMASTGEVPYPLNLRYQPQCSIQSRMQMNDQQVPAGASSFQDDQLPAVDNLDCLQDYNQHSQLQTSMDIDPSIAPHHTSESHIIEATTVDSQVLEAVTNTTGPLSSQDMNRGSPIMNVRSIYANDEKIRNLKRKLEELNDKEAVINEQMKTEFTTSSVRKKPKILVDRWLKETERARKNFQIIGQANAETLPLKVKVETLTRKVDELILKTLPQTLLIEEGDARGRKFLERELTGEAIHGKIEFIWDHLKKNHACKLGIYGMGGVGKTTIMMHIHNRLLEDATFDGVLFITVSQDFSIYKLQSDIWKALKFGNMEDEHEKKRAAMLSQQLERKKNCVLILDDVWERLDLEEMGIPIRANGLKLVLTTRSFDVCCQMQCQEKIKIELLSREEAESLFFEEFGFEVPLNCEIKAIVKSIVIECAGLPIGVITVARSMRGVTGVFAWMDFLVKLKESSMGQTDMEKKVLMLLKLSYDRLENRDIQQCFLSCALYPEDKLIRDLELIEFFIDQGLIGGLSTRKKQYDRGLTILNKLRNVGLLEDRHGIWMKMHDLIRDMALHIMSDTSIVKAGKQFRSIPPEEYWTNALEKVSLMESKISEIPLNMSPNCPKLSTLLLNRSLVEDVVIPDSFFEQLCGLKVLNLSGCDLRELPNSISDLVNLRALLLRKCEKLRRIPYLGKLTSLRKLDAEDCKSLEELEGLEKLVNLRYLNLTKTRIERLLKGTLDHSPKLQFLEVSAVIEENITKFGVVETFKCCLKNADDFNKCVRVIEQSNNPRYYYLRGGFEKSKFEVEVSDIARYGKLAGGTKLGRTVCLKGWSDAIVSVRGECTGIFILIPRDVQQMTLLECNGMTNLSSMGLLEYLDDLRIRDWENLGVVCGGHDEEVIDVHHSPAPALSLLLFPNLRKLDIRGCPKLKYLFGHGFKSNLPHLREIKIWSCGEMVGIIASVTSPPPYPLLAFPSLENLLFHDCGKMKRAVEFEWMPHFPNLKRIIVAKCDKMEEIIGGPPSHVPVKEISLESLYVYDCNKMRKLLSQEWLPHLQKLEIINVECCKGMVEMTSRGGQDQEGSIMTPLNNLPSSFQSSSISLPNLKRLYLQDLPQLKSICGVPISCDFMEELRVHKCPELKGIPLQLQLRETEGLPHIWVEDEEKWKTLMWDYLHDAQAILQPYLRKGEHANQDRLSPSPNAIELFAE